MRYPSDHKEKTRARILDAASRLFRTRGFSGIGVDGLMAATRLTSGAFYGHFRSKTAIFREVAEAGLERLRLRVRRLQDAEAERWPEALADYYLSPAHRANIAGGCGLPSLSPEVVRADAATRAAYQAGLEQALAVLTQRAPLDGPDGRRRAWALLALLAGGLTLARSVEDEARAEEIADAVRAATAWLMRADRAEPGL